MKEQQIVTSIEKELIRSRRWYSNNYGGRMSTSGIPDIITIDPDGKLLGIEVKAPGFAPTVNQFRRAVEIVSSGGRYIVAYGDFTWRFLTEEMPQTFNIGVEIGTAEFDAVDTFKSPLVELSRTTELILGSS